MTLWLIDKRLNSRKLKQKFKFIANRYNESLQKHNPSDDFNLPLWMWGQKISEKSC